MGEDKVFAGELNLGDDQGWQEVRLPFLDQWVRVRKLDTPEVARLSYLPDLLGFSLLMSKLQVEMAARAEGKDVGPEDEVDPGALAAENYRYQCHVAHLAVIKDPGYLNDELCDSCGFPHPPSLWTVRQAARLQPKDLAAINHVALNGDVLQALRPFSKAATPTDSSVPAEPGTSIQPTSS